MFDKIKKFTTSRQRAEICSRHGIKSRAGVSRLLSGQRINVAAMQEIVTLAEANEQAQKDLEARVNALGR